MTTIGNIVCAGEKLIVTESNGVYRCKTEQGEPVATLSKAVPGVRLPAGYVILKTDAENHPFRQALLEAGLFVDTGKRAMSGYEIWRRAV